MAIHISTHARGGLFGKLVFSGFGLVFALMGSLFIRQELNSLQNTRSMQEWDQTTGTIQTSEVQDAGEDFQLLLSYRYTVDGQPYIGERYGKQERYTAETIREIKQEQSRWDTGQNTVVHYNPEDPADAVLVLPTIEESHRTIGFTLIFPAVGLLFAAIPWLGGRRKKGHEVHDSAPKSHRLVPIVFGVIFTAAGLAMVGPLTIKPLRETLDARSWISTPATVLSSKVKSHSDDDGTTYSVYIAYRYVMDNAEYYGDRYSFIGGSSSGYGGKAEIVRRYPKDLDFYVFVNPSDPTDSVIHRDPTPALLFCLFPIPFIIMGLFVLTYGLRNRTQGLDMAQSREHIVILKARSPARKAFGLSLFTTVWLGIVYGLTVSDAPRLFPIVFGLFGLILLGAAFHAILSLFNPKPDVELTPGNMQPGTSVAVRWRMSGRADRIRSLSITLSCLKVTTETQRRNGKSETRVVRKPLHEEELQRTENQGEITQGTLQFVIPTDLPPSRPGNYSGIQWQLAFHGDIDRWPDMKTELPFIVYPEG